MLSNNRPRDLSLAGRWRRRPHRGIAGGDPATRRRLRVTFVTPTRTACDQTSRRRRRRLDGGPRDDDRGRLCARRRASGNSGPRPLTFRALNRSSKPLNRRAKSWIAAALLAARVPGRAGRRRCRERPEARLHLPRLPRHRELQELVSEVLGSEARRPAQGLHRRRADGVQGGRPLASDHARFREHAVRPGSRRPRGLLQLRRAGDAGAEAVGTPPEKAAACAACHGQNGIGTTDEYPNLAGQHADYIAQALNDYRLGKRKNPIMQPFAQQLTQDDIHALAKFFSAQSGLEPRSTTEPAGARTMDERHHDPRAGRHARPLRRRGRGLRRRSGADLRRAPIPTS